MRAAIALVVIYTLVGLTDIVSTSLAISSGAGAEANPLMATVMAAFGHGWILAKLAVQTLICLMVLWYPHRIVLGIFAAAVASNAIIVFNNFQIAGVF